MLHLDVTSQVVVLLAFICGAYAQGQCGSLLAPDYTGASGVPAGWNLCYIPGPPDPIEDADLFDMTCAELLKDLPEYGDAAGLLAAGGNFGCWSLLSFPDPEMTTACRAGLQHATKLSYCLRCTTMAICINYPPPPTSLPVV